MSKQEQTAPLGPEEDEIESDADLDHQQAQTEQIIETGAITTTKGKHVIHCLTIVGQVEGHYILPPQNKTTKYEHVIPQLVAIQESPDIEGLIIILNTVGGDVEAGLAIAELISGMKKPTVSLVLGGGHSIGVPLAVSARESYIVSSATMTIHPVRMNGVVLGVPQTLSYFDKMQERIVRFVEDNSGISSEEFRRLMMNTGELVMDVGTVLDGQQAVDCGLIDHLGGLSDAMGRLNDMIEEQEADRKAREKQPELPQMKRTPALASPRAIAQQRMTERRAARPRRVSAAAITKASAEANNATIEQHKLRQRGLDTEPDSGATCGGGGESSSVNPFGHAAPPVTGTGRSPRGQL